MIAVRLLNQPAQQKLRCRTDVAVVFLALMRAKLDNMVQNTDHQIVVFLFFVNLVGHELHQSFLIRVQLQRILNAPTDNKGVKRSLNIVRNAHAVCPLDGFAGILRRDHDDGNFVHPLRPVQLLQHLKSVHFGHMDIQQNQINHQVFLQQMDGLPPILRFNILIMRSQYLRQHHSIHL